MDTLRCKQLLLNKEVCCVEMKKDLKKESRKKKVERNVGKIETIEMNFMFMSPQSQMQSLCVTNTW